MELMKEVAKLVYRPGGQSAHACVPAVPLNLPSEQGLILPARARIARGLGRGVLIAPWCTGNAIDEGSGKASIPPRKAVSTCLRACRAFERALRTRLASRASRCRLIHARFTLQARKRACHRRILAGGAVHACRLTIGALKLTPKARLAIALARLRLNVPTVTRSTARASRVGVLSWDAI